MKTLQQFFIDAWRNTAGLPEIEEKQDANLYGSVPDIEEIKKSQFNPLFTKLMDNRMIMGYFRYGNKHTRKTNYPHIISAKRRITLYEETGNLENLVDAANMLRMEFDNPQYSKAYFESIDDGEHLNPIK